MSALPDVDVHATMLEGLGVGPDILSAADREALDRDGFVAFPDFIAPSWCEALVDRVEQLVAEEGAQAGIEHKQEDGAPRLSNLGNKGSVFDGIYTDPTVLAVARYVIGRPFKVFSSTLVPLSPARAISDSTPTLLPAPPASRTTSSTASGCSTT